MLPEELLSSDGMIIDQRKFGGYRYGKYTSDYNGCGWIAAYNACRLLGLACDERELIARLIRTLWFGGALGTRLGAVRRYFKERGVRTRVFIGRRAILRHAPDADGCILFYLHRRGLHFVCCHAQDGRFRFYNARCGVQRDVRALDAFLRTDVLYGAAMMISLKRPANV